MGFFFFVTHTHFILEFKSRATSQLWCWFILMGLIVLTDGTTFLKVVIICLFSFIIKNKSMNTRTNIFVNLVYGVVMLYMVCSCEIIF